MHRAAGFLAHTAMAIDSVALKSGYSSVQAFTRAFHSAYGMPPAQYRHEGPHALFQSPHHEGEGKTYDVVVTQLKPLDVFALEHKGSYMEIGRAFDPLFGWCGARGLLTPDTRTIGIFYDDPSVIAERDLRSCACIVAVSETCVAEQPVFKTRISGGTYAVLRYQGPYATMRSAYQWLYGEWLKRSGMEPADGPVIEEYLNNPRDTAPADLLTDICLPLKS